MGNKIYLWMFVFLCLVSIANATWFNSSCNNLLRVTVTNNHNVYNMIEHDVNFSIDTTSPSFENYRGGIYLIDKNTSETSFVREWWNETAFNSANTIIWTKTNVSIGNTKNLDIYYNCGGYTRLYTQKNVSTFYDDFSGNEIDSRIWNNFTNNPNHLSCNNTVKNGIYINQLKDLDDDTQCGIIANQSNFLVNANYSYLISFNFSMVNVNTKTLVQLTPNFFVGSLTAIIKDGFGIESTSVFSKRSNINSADKGVTSSYNITYGGLKNDTWYKYDIYLNNTIYTIFNQSLMNSSAHNLVFLNKTNYLYPRIYSQRDGSGSPTTAIAYYDYIRIIKYFSDSKAFSLSQTTINKSSITENLNSYNKTTTETKLDGFAINITYNSIFNPTITADLIYDNTRYTGTKIGTGEDIVFTKNINIPLTTGSKTFFWEITQINTTGDTIILNSTINTQYVNPLNLTLCGAGNANITLNFTFKDEINDNSIDAQVYNGNFTYSLDSDLIPSKSFSFNNLTEGVTSYKFCTSPFTTDKLYTSISFNYKNGTNYPQRSFSNNSIYLTNTTIYEKKLYLISTSSGQYVTFQVLNLADQPLSGVVVTAIKSGNIIESGTTGDDGTITFFLNPLYSHTFTFVKSGYTTYTTTLTPTQSSYTVTLSSTSAITGADNYYRGISFLTYPVQNILANNTNYTFSFNVTSSYYSLSTSGFRLTNSSGTFLGSASCAISTGCNSAININTYNNSDIVMHYYWTVNGNYTNGTRQWIVARTGGGGESSFDLFKRDFAKLGASFGLGHEADFTRALIAIFIILVLVGSLTYYTGIYSPTAIIGVVLAITWFLDELGFIPSLGIPPNGTPHFITILVALIFIINLGYEYTR